MLYEVITEFRSYDLSNVEILILDISSANILTEIKRLSHCIVVCFNVKKNLVSHFLIAKVFRLYYQPYIKTKKLKNYRKAVKFIRQRSIELKKLYIHEVNNEVVSVSDSTCIFTNYKYWARITSYNVCYTKLLRVLKLIDNEKRKGCE